MEKISGGVGLTVCLIAVIGGWSFNLGYFLDTVGFLALVCGAVLLIVAILAAVYFGCVEYFRGKIQQEAVEHERHMDLLRLQVVQPQQGVLPVSLDSVLRGDTLHVSAQQGLALIDAQRQFAPVPQTLTYSPHYNYKNQVEGGESPTIVESKGVPSFRELFTSGKLPKNEFLLGYDSNTNETVHVSWEDLYSCIVNGTSGTGKSTLLRLLLAQAALQGSQFMICDPHFGAGKDSLGHSLKPLAACMPSPVASSDAEILETVQYVSQVGMNRLHGDPDRTPLVLVVDETTALLSRSTIAGELAKLLGHISQETRKVSVYAIALGQVWNSHVIDTDVRNCFASILSCPTGRESLGRMIPSNVAKQTEEITLGQLLWYKVGNGSRIINFPNTTADDIAYLSSSLGGSKSSSLSSSQSDEKTLMYTSDEPLNEPVSEPLHELPSEPLVWTLKERKIIDALRQGYGTNKIVKEVLGVEGKGDGYMDAVSQIQSVTARLAAMI